MKYLPLVTFKVQKIVNTLCVTYAFNTIKLEGKCIMQIWYEFIGTIVFSCELIIKEIVIPLLPSALCFVKTLDKTLW